MARRKRRNAWRGSKRRHSLAAKRGWRGRRRGRRNPGYGYNPRRRRRYFNPGAVGSIAKAPLAAFNVPTVTKAALISGGALASSYLQGIINSQVVDRFAPGIGGGKIAQAAIGLGSAGLLGFLGGMIAPKYAGDLMIGGVVRVVSDIAADFGQSAFSGIGDFLTQRNVDSARSLSGMNDFLTQRNVDSARSLSGISEF